MNFVKFASDIATAHELLTTQLAGVYMRTRLQGTVTPRSALDMQLDAHRHVAQFVRTADALTAGYLSDTLGGALIEQSATSEGVRFVRAMHTAAHGYVSQLVRRVRGTDFKALMQPEADGGMKDLLRRRQESIEFTAKDAAGRNWPAEKLVKFLARDFAYQLTITAQARAIAAESDLAEVRYANPAHGGNGQVVSLTGATPLIPTLADLRDVIFHPNATAQLALHVPAHQ